MKIAVPSGGTLSRWLSSIAVTPGKSYDVSAWLNTQAAAAGGGQLVVTFWSAGPVYIPGSAVAAAGTVGGTQDWTRLSLSAVAPAGASSLRIEFRLSGTSGTLWADDVSAASS